MKLLKELIAEARRLINDSDSYHTRADRTALADMDMDVEFLTPVERIVLEKGRTTPFFPAGEETPMLLYARAEVLAQSGVKVRITVREWRE